MRTVDQFLFASNSEYILLQTSFILALSVINVVVAQALLFLVRDTLRCGTWKDSLYKASVVLSCLLLASLQEHEELSLIFTLGFLVVLKNVCG
jgi:hypothetical protein